MGFVSCRSTTKYGVFTDMTPSVKIKLKFRTIVTDPPWPEHGGGKIKRGADRHYPLMKLPEIVELHQRVLAGKVADNAHIYCWVTDNYLPDALKLVEAIGFRYIRLFVWVKTGKDVVDIEELEDHDLRAGIGQYARGCHEVCLFAVKGRGLDPGVYSGRRDIKSVIPAPHRYYAGKRVHSGKPEAFYSRVQARSRGPYLELFQRVNRPNWTGWGDEAPK